MPIPILLTVAAILLAILVPFPEPKDEITAAIGGVFYLIQRLAYTSAFIVVVWIVAYLLK